MRVAVVMKGLMLLAMGLAILTVAGCFGSDRNFAPSASGAAAQSGTPVPVRVATGPKIGNQAPDFTLKSLDGSTVKLSDFRGKPVLINFWATWCPPCKQEMPDIEKSYQKHKDEGYVFLGIDMQEDANTVSNFVKGKFSWTFLLDPSNQASNAYYVSGIPASFFIDRDGIVRDFKLGAMAGSEIESRLAKIK